MKKIYITIFLVLFIVYEGYCQDSIDAGTKRTVISNGIGLGSVIAGVTSWERNKSDFLAGYMLSILFLPGKIMRENNI